MKLFLLLIIVLVLQAFQCSKVFKVNAPACIAEKVNHIKMQPKWNPPAVVSEYEYEGRKVYLFSANCCDQYEELFDSNCNYLCAPSGGITGSGDRKCTDFFSKSKFIRQVWKDDRP